LKGFFYEQPYRKDLESYVVIDNDLVSESEGTGIVHIAPAFGIEDFSVARKEGLEVDCPVEDNGFFNEKILVKAFEKKHFSEVNELVIEDLKGRGVIVKEEKMVHSYPHD
jgi:isoleucyl-tRNA synthetase